MLAPLAACGTSTAEDGPSYGGQTIVPDLIFRGKDWGGPHGVAIQHVKFPSGGEAFEGLLSGEVNISNGGSGRLITVGAQRPDSVVIIGKWQYGGDRYSLLIPSGASISSPSDMRGKTVAADTGSGAFTLFQTWLNQNGLNPADVNVIESKVGDVGAALQAGSADIGVAWEPTASLLVNNGLVERLTTLKQAGQSPNFLLAARDWAEGHRTQLVAFLRAAIHVGDFIARDPGSAGAMASGVSRKEGVEAPPEGLAESLRHIEMAPEIDDASLMELEALAGQMVGEGQISEIPKFREMVDPSYLEQARAGGA